MVNSSRNITIGNVIDLYISNCVDDTLNFTFGNMSGNFTCAEDYYSRIIPAPTNNTTFTISHGEYNTYTTNLTAPEVFRSSLEIVMELANVTLTLLDQWGGNVTNNWLSVEINEEQYNLSANSTISYSPNRKGDYLHVYVGELTLFSDIIENRTI